MKIPDDTVDSREIEFSDEEWEQARVAHHLFKELAEKLDRQAAAEQE